MNVEGFSALVGLIMPIVIELIKKVLPETRKLNFIVTLVVSLIIGSISTLLSGKFDSTQLLGSIGAAFIASQAVYNLYWKGSKLEARIVGKKVSKK